MASRLILGTAQLGMAYGINNSTGQPDPILAKGIIEEAFRQGIIAFDTAQAYGQSEAVLGRAFTSLSIADKVRVITKLDPTLDDQNAAALHNGVIGSLERLKVKSLEVLMLHRQEQLLAWGPQIYPALRPLQTAGKVKRFGVSVYTPQAARQALESEGIYSVQVPSNILDQRFERAGIFRLAKERGKELYVRSVYLQGLLLMEPDKVPARLQFAVPYIAQVKALAQQYHVTLCELCLGYALAKWPDALIIVGAETVGQVAENAKIARGQLPKALVDNADILFKNVDERVVNPVLWPK